jgi:serine/threonine protein phosphatase 1
MGSIWAIGDVHGQAAMLERLLDALPRQSGDTTVFLGDYIDRGPDSARVIELALGQPDAVLLWGNHEDMAAFALGEPWPSLLDYDPYDWYRNGGWDTCASLNLSREDALSKKCPPLLLRLFERLELFFQDPLTGAVFVHAGVPPGVAPEDCDAEALLWDRENLNRHDPSGRFFLCGHTPQLSGSPLVRPDKLCLDTGAAYGGPLSALRWPERELYRSFPDGRLTGPVAIP